MTPPRTGPLPRKSALKRKSVYDDYGVASSSSSSVGKDGPAKKQRQLQLLLPHSQEIETSIEVDNLVDAKFDETIAKDAGQEEDTIVVGAVGKPGPRYGNKKREAFVILIHTVNPELISEVTIGQSFHTLGKANAAVTDLFNRSHPDYVHFVVDIGTATKFDDQDDDVYPDVKRRITPSGKLAYMWFNEEGRGELSVHKIIIEQ